jgi:hypothetical protein
MKRIRLTEADMVKLISKIIKEEEETQPYESLPFTKFTSDVQGDMVDMVKLPGNTWQFSVGSRVWKLTLSKGNL